MEQGKADHLAERARGAERRGRQQQDAGVVRRRLHELEATHRRCGRLAQRGSADQARAERRVAHLARRIEHERARLARLRPFAPRCLFVAAPDVPGNAATTLTLFPPWRSVIEEHDFPAAFIAQDGQEDHLLPENAYWLFLAGQDAWRERHGAALIAQTHALGYWGVHVGRVNSACRMRGCAALGADSCDGTSLRYVGVERGLRDVERWVRASNGQGGLFDLCIAL